MLLVGCATMFTSIVTVTSVVDTAMKAWAELQVKGLTSLQTDAKVIVAHDKYREACAVTQTALIAYKQTGDNTAYVKAVAVARATAADLISLIVPLLTDSQATKIKTDFDKAKTL